jgi:hypothetical protein
LIACTIRYLMSHAVSGRRPGDLLLLASARDDWTMGRSALSSLCGSHRKSIASKAGGLEGYFAKLRPIWSQKLKDLVFFRSFEIKKLFYDWHYIASEFIPPAPPPASPVPVSAAEKRKSA